MERTALTRLQPDFPHPDAVVLEPQMGADIEVARRRVELLPVVGNLERAFAEDGGRHVISFECDCCGSVAGVVQAEDEAGVARAEGAGELRAVADLAGAGEQRPADRELPALPRAQRARRSEERRVGK